MDGWREGCQNFASLTEEEEESALPIGFERRNLNNQVMIRAKFDRMGINMYSKKKSPSAVSRQATDQR